jgi:hypothetical protein
MGIYTNHHHRRCRVAVVQKIRRDEKKVFLYHSVQTNTDPRTSGTKSTGGRRAVQIRETRL